MQAQPASSRMGRPSNQNLSAPMRSAFWIVSSCCATTDSTSMLMRLNSSKHAHAPLCASPAKNLPCHHSAAQQDGVGQSGRLHARGLLTAGLLPTRCPLAAASYGRAAT